MRSVLLLALLTSGCAASQAAKVVQIYEGCGDRDWRARVAFGLAKEGIEAKAASQELGIYDATVVNYGVGAEALAFHLQKFLPGETELDKWETDTAATRVILGCRLSEAQMAATFGEAVEVISACGEDTSNARAISHKLQVAGIFVSAQKRLTNNWDKPPAVFYRRAQVVAAAKVIRALRPDFAPDAKRLRHSPKLAPIRIVVGCEP